MNNFLLEEIDISFSRLNTNFQYIVYRSRTDNIYTNIHKFLDTKPTKDCGFKLISSTLIPNSNKLFKHEKGQALQLKTVSFERIYWTFNTSLILVTKITFVYFLSFSASLTPIVECKSVGCDFIKVLQSPFNLYYAPFDHDSTFLYKLLANNQQVEDIDCDLIYNKNKKDIEFID